ncbi:hypothetical protein [Parapedobacter indicus]|uniref:Uncharacterized protein n=1 Tax=Parapedobacter indicus TaxID=1477437 RepID=A0A1I3E411_9SPHI|nr:hypothetical protein [Parapedobacter indicus]PPL04949.1 hypothetical protein CLV26_101760 [Parapedobacter indicus]SFH93431.1 hypothetical protein SAMN05444682_101746 [Parapedobacter indicus]
MKTFTTEILALDPASGVMKKWAGPYIQAESFEAAEHHCQENGMGYCEVTGQLVAEIDEETGIRIDFDNLN